ncbi:MAG: hypothetical protein GX413_11025 [Acetobacter sp.]|nr:hypothetical protein [Acetobacter sp.]
MNKIICVGVAAFSFVIGFLFCAFVFVFSGENTDKWGDLATWTGSGVAFLALIAAVFAAVWSKRSSNQTMEDNRYFSLLSFIQVRTLEVNESFKEFTKKLDKPLKFEEVHSICDSFSGEFRRIYSNVSLTVGHSKVSEEKKNIIMLGFFSGISYSLIMEIIAGSTTKKFWGNTSYGGFYFKNYKKSYSEVKSQIRRLEMYGELFAASDRDELIS